MPDPRGRFSMEQINGVLYAIGGSDGHGCQTKIHCFDVATQKWKTLCSTSNARVSQGVIAMNDTLYLVCFDVVFLFTGVIAMNDTLYLVCFDVVFFVYRCDSDERHTLPGVF
ncbi:kelch-like protein 5 [Mizuhopecten yessoensis]|uniref:kelch-like protein 5 n=1 Tax=Mizuhopecten yessoensis TaxID=6573 RepID=UPI000B45F50B|nr:kelch-like protein 5 [Mizuhopecten yessoensis]